MKLQFQSSLTYQTKAVESVVNLFKGQKAKQSNFTVLYPTFLNQEDRRVTNVFLTEKGFEFQQRVKEVFYQIDEQCFAGFNEDERNQILQYLDRIYNNLKEGES